MSYIVYTALSLGLIYSLVSIALFISYRTLDIADLTTDGSYVLGMATAVKAAYMGQPVLGLFLALLCGALAGLVTAFLQTRLSIPSILAGIITNTGLYTVNLAVLNFSSNLALLKKETVYTLFRQIIPGQTGDIILTAIIVILIILGLNFFTKTRIGLSIRATGDNREMVLASSINPSAMIMTGLAISNSLTALCGALMGQLQKSCDINAGTGIVVIGLACLIIGETLTGGRKSSFRNILAAVMGSIIYRILYAIIIQTRIFPVEYLKLVTAIALALFIAVPELKKKTVPSLRKKGAA